MISEQFEGSTTCHSTLTGDLQVPAEQKVKIIPSIDQAKLSKQPPTDGEVYLLEYLENNFDCESEVYFQPCFNGDRPDVVIVKKGVGVIIIEVKDWDIKHYDINSKNQWLLKYNNTIIKSPYAQVFSYKKNMFEIHVNGLLEKKMKNENFYKLIKVYVYFHNVNQSDISNLYSREISEIDRKIKNENIIFKEKCILNNSIEEKNIAHKKYLNILDKLNSKKQQFIRDQNFLSVTRDSLKKIFFHNKDKNELFSDPVYLEFIRLLKPPMHYANQGKHIEYTKPQARLSESFSGEKVKIRGLAGSGKTTVLAMRAVNAHKRHGSSVLILTYNLTLCMYIKDKISEVREDFSWSSFEIINYHKFMTFALNEAGVEIEIDENAENFETQLDTKYYSNTNVFLNSKFLRKYDTILIDEVQDYKSEWLTIIKDNFLAEDGEMVIFGDEKQNIYDRAVDEERKIRVSRDFGQWKMLSRSFRYKPDSRILTLTRAFQHSFLSQNYDLDNDESPQASIPIMGINAIGFYEEGCLEPVARTIIDIAKKFSIHPNDITILSSQEKTLKKIDHIVRTGDDHKERTLTTFESLEVSRHQIYSKDSKKVSNAKKIGFNLNSGVMKLSTIHSFKGYESPNIFLFIHEKDSPEIVYTGLTRAKENIVVFIKKGSKYADFFQERLGNIETYLPSSTSNPQSD